jgi:hypothetical protein
MRKLLFTLMLLASSLALAGTVYKWVDEDGVVHYSDQPHQNAQKLQVHDVQTYKPSALDTTPAANGAPPNGVSPQRTGYQGCAIVQPSDAQDFANIDSLPIVVQTDPRLRAGDQVYVTLDGQPLNNGAPTGGQFALSPVDRGSHTLQAVVKGPDGAVLCQTPGVSFNVHQTSVLGPANPLRPH